MPTSKRWVFTDYSLKQIEPHDLIAYCTWQQEKCPESGRLHLQGYLELKRSGNQSVVYTALGRRLWTRVAKGNGDEAAAYAQKEESRIDGPWEFGERERGGPGERNDLRGVIARVQAGDTEQSIANAFPGQYIRYHKGISRLIGLQWTARDRGVPCTVTVLIGNPGSGKTRSVYDSEGDNPFFTKDDTEWWDGYRGEKKVLFDDFDGPARISPVQLLRICDRYPIRVQVKGGYVELAATHFFFTTTIEIENWYRGRADEWSKQVEAFKRRVTQIIRTEDS